MCKGDLASAGRRRQQQQVQTAGEVRAREKGEGRAHLKAEATSCVPRPGSVVLPKSCRGVYRGRIARAKLLTVGQLSDSLRRKCYRANIRPSWAKRSQGWCRQAFERSAASDASLAGLHWLSEKSARFSVKSQSCDFLKVKLMHPVLPHCISYDLRYHSSKSCMR